ncbi:MAG: adenylate/guanylate cyclase domain-containing protein [Reyranellaceae bacterium]
MTVQRRLAAILVADVVGYSRLVGHDEAGTLARLAALRRAVIEPTITQYAGRLFKAVGDGFLVEFASAVQAVTAARAIQEANATGALPLRIGIHVGDVVVEGDDLMGDGVNIAARIEGVAEAGGISISRAVHEQVRDKLGVSFVDKGEVALKNLARPVQVFAVGGTASSSAGEPAPALSLPDKPSIAVLPFQNMSGDPEQEYFADGMVEDIITALSRTKALFVIARNSTFTYKGRAVDIKQVGRELGVRYVLEGSVRKAGNRARITGQLIDAGTGMHIWADRFEGGLDDIFELQDNVTSNVVANIAPTVERAEIARIVGKPTAVLAAYDYHLRGLACLREFTKERNEEALGLFLQATMLDPKLALSYARAAYCYQNRKAWQWDTITPHDTTDAERLVRQALAADNQDPRVLALCGWVLGYVVGRLGEAVALLDLAVDLDPNSILALNHRGWAALVLGDAEKATNLFERALRHNPIDPLLFGSQAGLANAHVQASRYDQAIDLACRVIHQRGDVLQAHWALIAGYALAGRLVEAKAACAAYTAVYPNARISNIIDSAWAATTSEVLEKYARAFRLAGLRE